MTNESSFLVHIRQTQGWPAKYLEQINDEVFISALRHIQNCKIKPDSFYSWGNLKCLLHF